MKHSQSDTGWGDVAPSQDIGDSQEGFGDLASSHAAESDEGWGEASSAAPSDTEPMVCDAGAAPGGPPPEEGDGQLGAPPQQELAVALPKAAAQRLTTAAKRRLLRPAYELVRQAKALFRHIEPFDDSLEDGEGYVAGEIVDEDVGGGDGAPDAMDEGAGLAEAPRPDPPLPAVPEDHIGPEAARLLRLRPWRKTMCRAARALANAVQSSGDPVADRLQLPWKYDAATHYLAKKKRQMGIEAEADSLGVSRQQAQCMLQAAACAATVLWRDEFASGAATVHDDMVSKGARPLLIVDHCRYDETPMRARMRDPEQHAAGARAIVRSADAPAAASLRTQCVSSHVVKILQTERHVSMLYEMPDKSFLCVKAWIPCWLQSMGDGKAETYVQALIANECELPPELVAAFKGKLRMVCTDRGSACLRCERALGSRRADITVLHTHCEVHKAYGVHRYTFASVHQLTRIVKDIAACLNGSDGMRSFRAALRQTIADWLDYRDGSPPSLREYRQNTELLDLFMAPKSPATKLRRAIILTLANGDWSRNGTLTHNCVGRACCRNKEHCLQKFQTFFIGAVASSSPPTWPDARWLGAEDAIGWLGSIQAIHGLFVAAFCEWCGKAPRATAADLSRTELMGESRGAAAKHPGNALREDLAGDDTGAGEGGELEAGAEVEQGDPSAAAADFEQKRIALGKKRASMSAWLAAHRHDVTGLFLLLAKVARPLAVWMGDLLKVAGVEWERARLSEFQEPVGHVGDEGCNQPAASQGLLAHRNDIERKCLAEIRQLMLDPLRWRSMPLGCQVGAFQARSFIMLSAVWGTSPWTHCLTPRLPLETVFITCKQ